MIPEINSAGRVNKKMVDACLNMTFVGGAIVTVYVPGKHGRGVNEEPVALELQDGFLVGD